MAAKHSLMYKDVGSLMGDCSVCGWTNIRKNGKYGYVCMVAAREARRRWREANPEKHKENRRPAVRRSENLKRNYSLSVDEYEAMLAGQGGGCAICKRKPRPDERRFPVDHDHSCCPTSSGTGMRTCGQCIRGIVCPRCNLGLGYLETWYFEHKEAALRHIRGAEAGHVDQPTPAV